MAGEGAPRRVEDRSGSETLQQRRRVLYIPGISNSHIRGLPFERAFAAEYGHGNVMVTNSIVSKDKKDSKRWEKMADYIMASAQEGLDIVVHSLGSAELYRAIKIIERRDRDFFTDTPKDKITFVLMDPSGFNRGIRQKIDYARRAARLVKEHGNEPGSEKRTLARGVDALVAFPPAEIATNVLVKGVRNIFPNESKSSDKQGLRKISFGPLGIADHSSYKEAYLSDEQKGKVRVGDIALDIAFVQGQLTTARDIILDRGELMKGALDQVYLGSLETKRRESGRMRVGGFSALSMVALAIGRRPMDQFKSLFDMGYFVGFLSPEHSIAVPLGRVIDMYDSREQAQKYIKVAELFTHASITAQPDFVAHHVRRFKSS